MLDVRKLRYFATVAELGSFTKAAAALHIAQPALSRQVQQLEQELGVELLLRTSRRVQLTDAGEAMLRHARTIDRDFERMVEDMHARQGTPIGKVVFGIPPTLAETIVPTLVARLKRELPLVSLRIVEGLTPVLAEWVRDNKADLAVLSLAVAGDADQFPGVAVEALTSEDMVVAERAAGSAARDHYGVDEVMSRPMVLSDMLASIVYRQLGEVREKFRFELEIDSVQAIRTMVLRGEATTILPISMLSDEIARGIVRASRITPDGIRRQLMIAQPSYRQLTQATEALKRAVHTVVAEMSAEGMFTLAGRKIQSTSTGSRSRGRRSRSRVEAEGGVGRAKSVRSISAG
jgi:LysR family transcriptional regulator, nitrogen assimilation regulatory protein